MAEMIAVVILLAATLFVAVELIELQEAVRSALYEAANEEIKKHKEQFEREMQATKRNMVSKIVNTIQIQVTQLPASGEYVIQTKLNGGKDGN